MHRYLFTAAEMAPFYCESSHEARNYMQEYAIRGHKDCKVWHLTDFMNCQTDLFPLGLEERMPEFLPARTPTFEEMKEQVMKGWKESNPKFDAKQVPREADGPGDIKEFRKHVEESKKAMDELNGLAREQRANKILLNAFYEAQAIINGEKR